MIYLSQTSQINDLENLLENLLEETLNYDCILKCEKSIIWPNPIYFIRESIQENIENNTNFFIYYSNRNKLSEKDND